MAGSVAEAREWMQLAEQTLEATRVLEGKGLLRHAVSRSYYAMFYAARAALSIQGIQVAKHSAVISAFGRQFAKTGRLPVRLHRTLVDSFDDRQEADYALSWRGSELEARQRLTDAEEFVSRVRQHLSLQPE